MIVKFKPTDFPFGWNLVLCHWCDEYHLPGPEYCSDSDTGENMNLQKYAGEGGSFEQKPFLKGTDIGKGATVKIITVREAPRQMKFSDILADVQVGKKEYTWGLRYDSVTVQQLIGRLGPETDKWKGKNVKLVTVDWFNKKTRKKTKLINVA